MVAPRRKNKYYLKQKKMFRKKKKFKIPIKILKQFGKRKSNFTFKKVNIKRRKHF
jgi:hypothetical protein